MASLPLMTSLKISRNPHMATTTTRLLKPKSFRLYCCNRDSRGENKSLDPGSEMMKKAKMLMETKYSLLDDKDKYICLSFVHDLVLPTDTVSDVPLPSDSDGLVALLCYGVTKLGAYIFVLLANFVVYTVIASIVYVVFMFLSVSWSFGGEIGRNIYLFNVANEKMPVWASPSPSIANSASKAAIRVAIRAFKWAAKGWGFWAWLRSWFP